MVAGNFVRKLNKHKQDKIKIGDEEQIKKIDAKIERVHDDIKLLKKINSYEIAKKATCKTDLEYWNKLISDCKAKREDILTARVIIKNNIQKQVAKFRNDHKDCDEWLNEYIEYREKKRELMASPKERVGRKFKNKEKKFIHRKGAKKIDENVDHRDDDRKPLGSDSKRQFDKASHEKLGKEEEKERRSDDTQTKPLHPSWESKRREKELLKAAFSGQIQPTKKLVFRDFS